MVFREWMDRNPMSLESASFEHKDSRGSNSIPFKEIKPEQRTSALANKSDKGNLIRVAKGTRGAADYIFLRNAYAYFVLNYPDFFCFIDANRMEQEIAQNKNKSLVSERAKVLSIIVIKK